MFIMPKASAAIIALMLSAGAQHASIATTAHPTNATISAPAAVAPHNITTVQVVAVRKAVAAKAREFLSLISTRGAPTQEQQALGLRPTINDLDYVYRTVYGEARSQGEEEIEAVINVIYNRWRTGLWGDSMKQVVLSPYQFSVWNKRDPNRKIVRSDGIYGMHQFDRVKRLVDEVIEGRLAGARADITGGATHYYHPHSMTTKVVRRQGMEIRVKRVPSWSLAYISKARIGDGWFFRKL